MIKLALSLTVFNQEYENKLLKYVIPSLIKNIKNNKIKILFFINASNNNILNKITEIFIKEKLDFKIFSKIFKNKEINNFNYKNLTKNQVSHFSKSKKLKCDYIVFLYADMFYGPKSIENSLKILSKNRSIKGCCSFELNYIKINILINFIIFIQKSKVTTPNDYLINNLKNIISPFIKIILMTMDCQQISIFFFHKINNYFFKNF